VRLAVHEPDLCRRQRQPGTVPELPLLFRTFRSHMVTIALDSMSPRGNQNPEVRSGRHVIDNLHVHLVFVTKYRRQAFTDAMLTRTEEITRGDFEAELKQFNGEHDRVHLLVHYPPKEEYSTHIRRYLRGGHFWSGSYFAESCGGAPLTIVKQYIENQQRPVA
jgi:putative transposase